MRHNRTMDCIDDICKEIKSCEDISTSSSVTLNGRVLRLYSKIDSDAALSFSEKIHDARDSVIDSAMKFGIDKKHIPIKIKILSYGGIIDSALSIIENIREVQNDGCVVDTVVEGYAASAATLISVMGTNKYMGKHSFMLVHQLRGGFWGKHHEFEEELESQKIYMDLIREIYLKKTKFKPKELEALLKKDKTLTAKECLEFGLVDKIL